MTSRYTICRFGLIARFGDRFETSSDSLAVLEVFPFRFRGFTDPNSGCFATNAYEHDKAKDEEDGEGVSVLRLVVGIKGLNF